MATGGGSACSAIHFPHRGKRANAIFNDGHLEGHPYGDFTSFAPVVQVR
jgi:prepilin-type processing-associated H-X9-DG protein